MESSEGKDVPPKNPFEVKLGEVLINKDAFELDLKINEGYQSYSQELLRLSLLILAGLGAVWVKLYVPPVDGILSSSFTSCMFILAFSTTALSAGASLIHRYTSADSLAYQLTALRRRARGRPKTDQIPSDADIAKRQEKKRDTRFLWSGRLLRASISLLFTGLVFFCISMGTLMFDRAPSTPQKPASSPVGVR